MAPDKFGYRIYLYGPWQNHFDASLMRTIRFAHEKANLQIRATCLDRFNLTNFQLGATSPNSAIFGQTTTAYQGISNAQDPGSRILGFIVRVNFSARPDRLIHGRHRPRSRNSKPPEIDLPGITTP